MFGIKSGFYRVSRRSEIGFADGNIKNGLASKVPGLRHNGHCDFKFKRKNYWLPAMGNLDLDMKSQWPYKFTLSEIQCGAGIIMMQKLDKLNELRIKRAKKFIKSFNKFKELSFN